MFFQELNVINFETLWLTLLFSVVNFIVDLETVLSHKQGLRGKIRTHSIKSLHYLEVMTQMKGMY